PRAKARLTEAASMSRHRTRDDAAIQINLGIVLSREGDPDQAAVAFERSAEIALGAGDVRFASIALANAVENFLRLEAVEAAATSAERALRLAQTIGDPVAVSTAQANLGLVFAKRGDWAKAEQNLLGSVELIARLDNPYSLASRYQDLAQLYEAQGRGADAAPWRARDRVPYAGAGELYIHVAGPRLLVPSAEPDRRRARDVPIPDRPDLHGHPPVRRHGERWARPRCRELGAERDGFARLHGARPRPRRLQSGRHDLGVLQRGFPRDHEPDLHVRSRRLGGDG